MRIWITLFFIGFCNSAFAQLNNIEITFEVSNSLKMPYYYEEIKLFHIDNEYKISVISKPYNKEFKLSKSKLDTIYPLAENQYNNVISMIKQLPTHKITEEILNLGKGVEGTKYKLEYGNWQNRISIMVWSPEFETEKRNLVEFLALCRDLLILAKFDPDKI